MKYIINGGIPLYGTVSASSAKNAVLVQMASAVLAEGVTTIHAVDKISDVLVMADLLQCLGCSVSWSGNVVSIDATTIDSSIIPQDIATKMRASIFLLGSLLGRTGYACTHLPGGCAIGSRPIDIHLDVLSSMGVNATIDGDSLHCVASNLVGADITLRMPSVGATENAIMCAVLARGTTILHNCAVEPEVVALCHSLVDMGANIEGIGTSHVVVVGVDRLHGATIHPIADRIVAATYLIAGCMTYGDITVDNVCASNIEPLLEIFDKVGVQVDTYTNSVHIRCSGYRGLGDIHTAPYPMFPTDMQSLVLSMATIASGNTSITEHLFENRLVANCMQLSNMGADISISGNRADIVGVDVLRASQLRCCDLRGGAGLVLASLCASGCSQVYDIYHINRGYYRLHDRLVSLGADIQLVD